MPRRIYTFDDPDRFVAGTVGEPGNRTFFLQARRGGDVVSVALEKAQVAVLAQQLDALLDLLVDRGLAVIAEADDLSPTIRPAAPRATSAADPTVSTSSAPVPTVKTCSFDEAPSSNQSSAVGEAILPESISA